MGVVWGKSRRVEGVLDIIREKHFTDYLGGNVIKQRRRNHTINVLLLGVQGSGKSCLRNTFVAGNELDSHPRWNGVEPKNNRYNTTDFECSELIRDGFVVMRVFEVPGNNFGREGSKNLLKRIILGIKVETPLLVTGGQQQHLIDEANLEDRFNEQENKIDCIILVASKAGPAEGTIRELDRIHDLVTLSVNELRGNGINTMKVFLVYTNKKGNLKKEINFQKHVHGTWEIENYTDKVLRKIGNFKEFDYFKGEGYIFCKEESVHRAEDYYARNPRSAIPYFNKDTHDTVRKIVVDIFENDTFNSVNE